MEKQEHESKWDDLVRELGAEIPPETVQREEAALQASQAAASTTPRRDKDDETQAKVPKRSAPGWDNLASDFGLPIPEPVTVPEIPKPVAPREETTRPAQRPREREREETHARRPERQDREQRSRRDETEHRRGGRGGRGQRDRRPPRRHDRDSEGESDGAAEHEERLRERDAPPPSQQDISAVEPETRRELPPKPAAVSLWHKIFGSPAEQVTKVAGPPEAEAIAPSDYRDEPRPAGSGFADSHTDEPVEFRDDAGELGQSSGSSMRDDEEGRAEPRGGRSRRRRGRGRGRGRRSEGHPRDREATERGHVGRSERSQQGLDSEFADDLSLDDDQDEATLGDDGSDLEGDNGEASSMSETNDTKALQRAIPSWDEAIGFIVDSNMQGRSQRRPPSRSGSRDSSSRGRSRGNRKS